MKKILTILLAAALLPALCPGGGCSAQVIENGENVLSVRGCNIYMNGERMNREKLCNLEGFNADNYKSGRWMFASGLTLVCVGGVSATISGILIGGIVSTSKEGAKGIIPGLAEGALLVVTLGSTLLFEGAGIPLTCVGLNKIKASARDYNSKKKGTELALTPSFNLIPSAGNLQPVAGVTLALNF